MQDVVVFYSSNRNCAGFIFNGEVYTYDEYGHFNQCSCKQFTQLFIIKPIYKILSNINVTHFKDFCKMRINSVKYVEMILNKKINEIFK